MHLDPRRPSVRLARCVACEATFDPPSWEALPRLERFHREELRDLLSEWPWPREACLEVRACRCGATVARLVL